MLHDKCRFVEKLYFITTPGYLSGPGAREAAGLPLETGPYRVITSLAVIGYHPDTKRMILLQTQPGIEVEEVLDNTGFELLTSDDVTENYPPTEAELRLLRVEVDKTKFYI